MPKIAHIANLWTLVGHPSSRREWDLEKKIAAIAEAGFDGITTSLTPEMSELAEKNGMLHKLGFISSSDPKKFGDMIQAQKDAGAVQINVQLDDDFTKPTVAVKHWVKMMKLADNIGGLVMSLEVHRDTCTETPEKTYEIAKLYRKMTGKRIRMNFDFSHFAVVKHLGPANYSERLLDHPKLVQNSEQSHCRPFNGHHCQVAVTHNGKVTPELKSYMAFVEDLFRLWKSAPKNQEKTLFVCPELGPLWEGGAGYNITGLGPAWPDAVVLRQHLQRAWLRAKV